MPKYVLSCEDPLYGSADAIIFENKERIIEHLSEMAYNDGFEYIEETVEVYELGQQCVVNAEPKIEIKLPMPKKK